MKELLRCNSINLRILSKVKPSGRIGTQGKILNIEKCHVLQGVWRFLNRDSRIETVGSIRSVIQIAVELSGCIVGSKIFVDGMKSEIDAENGPSTLEYKQKLRQLQELKAHLEGAVGGIRNLMQGYSNDEHVVSELEVIVQTVREQVEVISDTLHRSPVQLTPEILTLSHSRSNSLSES